MKRVDFEFGKVEKRREIHMLSDTSVTEYFIFLEAKKKAFYEKGCCALVMQITPTHRETNTQTHTHTQTYAYCEKVIPCWH